jgi:hypothetical protein
VHHVWGEISNEFAIGDEFLEIPSTLVLVPAFIQKKKKWK